MDDNQDNQPKAQPNVFYAKKKERDLTESDKSRGKKATHRGGDKPYSYSKPARPSTTAPTSGRIETFNPNKRRAEGASFSDSPWRQKVKDTEQQPSFSDEKKRKFDHSQRIAQQKEEVIIYSENSCRAVFKYRPQAIIKAFITEDKAYAFGDLVSWLVEHKLGYDIVDSKKLDSLTETPHHGGIALIVKKRTPISSTEYCAQREDASHDLVVAIDDINNPHNLGGLMRTAAFFKVNGVLLRQTALLDSGAALRVAEGGSEACSLIKTDDFIATLDQFKRQGYQLVVLLPCRVKAIKSIELRKFRAAHKSVLILFQQINPSLVNLADKVIHIDGSEAMSSLNIAVASGLLLSQLSLNKVY